MCEIGVHVTSYGFYMLKSKGCGYSTSSPVSGISVGGGGWGGLGGFRGVLRVLEYQPKAKKYSLLAMTSKPVSLASDYSTHKMEYQALSSLVMTSTYLQI